MKVTDIYGKEFKSMAEMCRFHDIPYEDRAKLLKQEAPKKASKKDGAEKNRVVEDHLGRAFQSIKEMCEYYNIGVHTLNSRLHRGWSLEKALTTPVKATSYHVYDHLGTRYNSFALMCEHYGLQPTTVRCRLQAGHDLEDALTRPSQGSGGALTVDHLGNVYRSVYEMCRHYGIKKTTYFQRLSHGWTLEDTLTVKVRHASVKAGDIVYLNNGIEAVVKKYMNAQNIMIELSDGSLKLVSAESIKSRQIGHKGLHKNGEYCGFRIHKRSWSYDHHVFYECTCKKCGASHILDPQEMAEHQKICAAAV